jgi:CheY-like chemotaxis protein
LARKILLADDSVTAQNMGRKILADAGYDVLTVNNGSAALKRIAECMPDLIILDVYMPGYSGLEVCQRLKDAAETAHIPVLLSVGKLEPFKPQEARRVRADAHIVKPFEASQLLTAIARLEDQMVPQQKGNHRFASSGANTADEPFSRPEESRILGRGAKLAKKQNKETSAEREDDADSRLSPQAASFRDFRKKAKSPTPSAPVDDAVDSVAEPVSQETVSQETGPLAKLPGDITAEELSALSEVAAKLNEARPAASSAIDTSSKTTVAASAGIADSQLEKEVANLPAVETSAAASAATEEAVEAVALPVQEAYKPGSSESIEPSRPVVKAWEISAAASEIQIPVAQFEPASLEPANDNAVRASEQLSQVEPSQTGFEPAESQTDPQPAEAQPQDAVSAASFAQEPAPVDQQDEPMFASARAVEAYAEEIAKVRESHFSISETPQQSGESLERAPEDYKQADGFKKDEFASIGSSFAQAAFAEPTTSEAPSAQSISPEPVSAESASPELAAAQSGSVEVRDSEPISTETAAASSTNQPSEPEAPMPSEAELAEALRLLTPATMQSEVQAQAQAGVHADDVHADAQADVHAEVQAEVQAAATSQMPEPVPAAHQWFDSEETMELPAGKRWVAEALELSPEEASMSLEAEMFRAFAASAEKIETLRVENPLATIQLAVENRLAAEAAEAAAAQALNLTAEAAPKAMAAVAPAGATSATSAESDIASIVDKVMADLRPRIVEEIARKLSGK